MSETGSPPAGAANAAGKEAGEEAARLGRRRRLIGLVSLVVLAAAAWWGWGRLHGVGAVATDNAYVHGDVVVVTPQVAGTVVAVLADDTQPVEAGQVLVSLDATDARNALQRETVRLAGVVRETRAMYLGLESLRSTISIRQSGVERARVELARATEGYRRRQSLQTGGAVSREDLQNAKAAYDAARSELASAEMAVVAARDELNARRAMTDGIPVERHPSVLAAAVQMREAWLAVRRAEVRAPLSGQVARRNVQVGQRVAAGANLMSIVALDRVWVEANFKETQLHDLRVGQRVRLTSDLHGRSIEYAGRVAGLGAGTGSAFSLLPAQNATGNWIKIVQRVPVRIEFDGPALRTHPLRIGASMQVVVDTRDRDAGAPLGAVPRRPAARTDVFTTLEKGADEAVAEVIEQHLGRAGNGRRPDARPTGESPATDGPAPAP